MDFLLPSDIVTSHGKQPKLRRAAVACRRCRRLRVKCRHIAAHPPCESCTQTGHECIFPKRGEPDFDRAYRQERRRKQSNLVREASTGTGFQTHEPQSGVDARRASTLTVEPQNEGEDLISPEGFEMQDSVGSTPAPKDRWNLLPPFEEVVEGCQVFIRSYFQLGFLPKTSFFERLQKDRESISVFLLLSILSISARFTPSLVRRYGSCQNATNIFLQRAATMTLEYMYKPSLEAIQSFVMISLAEWGKGDKDRSSTHMGIAVRMAGTLRLHREETYHLPENATADEIVESEVARRTFWMLENHDSLHSGYNAPVSFALSDITTLLPCEEQEFAFGIAPTERTALIGTASDLNHNQLMISPSRSLFATLIQCHNIWGQIARRVVPNEINQQQHPPSLSGDTALSEGEYLRLTTLLKDFEDNLPTRHRWSVWNLRGFKAERLDLAYLSVVTMIRLSNIILRRISVHRSGEIDSVQACQLANRISPYLTSHHESKITKELFSNMVALNEQIEAYFSLRSPDQGFPAFVVYCVYICGSLANHLQKSKDLAEVGADAVSRTMEISESSAKALSELQDAWPTAKRWSDALLKASQSQVAAHAAVASGGKCFPKPPAAQDAHSFGNDGAVTSTHVGPSNRAFSTITEHHADYSDMFESSDAFDLMPDDSWSDRYSGIPPTGALDSDLAFNLWPSGDIWEN